LLSSSPLRFFLEQFQQVSFLHLHTCEYIICTIFTLLPPFPSTSSLSPVPTYSIILFSDFVEEKNIEDKKKNMMFLLVWERDSSTGRFLVLFPSILCITTQISSSLPDLFTSS
jgi:hypothetical protein